MSANEYVVINGKRYAAMAGVGAETSSGEPAELVVNENRQASGEIETRVITFDAAADMPADITSAANVAAGRIEISNIPPTAKSVQIIFHGVSGIGGTTNSHQAAALGVIISVDATDDVAANENLTQIDITGGDTSTLGKEDTFILSNAKPERWVSITDGFTRLDCIGIPTVGVGTEVYIPCYLEFNFYG